MKVTDLRVVGFKSFVDQISMKIEPGLTGIVGPNGCGKSNILESLRWVMGATSARALRGGEMDDVIFAGTDKRPARDIAEVTIVLDNSDGLAPAPFQEAPVLEVSRRIRRAAGSSFRINGKEVRARDVQLLFADASTGANSPALVRQNQVSELINAKPENRRRILEEAAGIAGLYTRRHEAELKLRGAQTNLERLDDVILNMNDTLATLKRQARQALKYRTIADDIRALEAFLFAKRLQESEQANTLAIAALKEAEKALADATLADNQASRVADQSDDVLNPLRQEQAIAEAVLRRLEGQKFAADREIKAAEEALASAQADLARIAKDEERETLLRDDAHQTRSNLAEERAKLPPDDGDTLGIEEAISRLKTFEAAREAAELALSHLTTQRAEAAAERNAQIRACEDAKSQMRRRMDAVARAEEELKRLQANLPQASALEAARNQATQVADTAAQAAERADQCEKDAELAAIKEAEARETSRREQNDLDRALSEQKALQATTHQPKAGTWPKALDHIKPAAGYERALAAAFGDELDAALDPAAPIAWTMAEARQFTWPQAITPLTEFVTTAPPALLARLAAIGLVGETDFDAVIDLPTGARIVTRSGNMRRWDGYVRRKDAVANSAAILEQRARLAELEEHVVPLQTQVTNTGQSFSRCTIRRGPGTCFGADSARRCTAGVRCPKCCPRSGYASGSRTGSGAGRVGSSQCQL
jgi:chromosome segregation protein